MLDADQALSKFMDLEPDRAASAFSCSSENMLRKLQAASVAKCPGVVVFGERVAVLWAQKKYDAAIRLEELWNEFVLTCSFYLFCAYPANVFRNGSTLVPTPKFALNLPTWFLRLRPSQFGLAKRGDGPDRVSRCQRHRQ